MHAPRTPLSARRTAAHERSFAAAALVFALGSTAFAHATLDPSEAAVGSYQRAAIRVPHGCAGAATLKLRVRIPEGVVSVKPSPKPGWELETVKAAYAKPQILHGRQLTEGVQEIVWTGNLLDEHYDEFVFQAYLSDALQPGTTAFFPTVQECEGGKAERWIEIPASGKTSGDYRHPAPGLRLTPAKPTH
jgi:uncharacterized protein YcnI